MEDSNNNYLRELLEQRGWYKRWYTQVMADILLPHVLQMAQPEKNALLTTFKEEENNMLALYMVKEFLKTVGLPSTGKIFEAEAGLCGIEQEYQPLVQEHFSLLTPSTQQQINPPLLSQALHIWKAEATEQQLLQTQGTSRGKEKEDDLADRGHNMKKRGVSEAELAVNRLLHRDSVSDSTGSDVSGRNCSSPVAGTSSNRHYTTGDPLGGHNHSSNNHSNNYNRGDRKDRALNCRRRC